MPELRRWVATEGGAQPFAAGADRMRRIERLVRRWQLGVDSESCGWAGAGRLARSARRDDIPVIPATRFETGGDVDQGLGRAQVRQFKRRRLEVFGGADSQCLGDVRLIGARCACPTECDLAAGNARAIAGRARDHRGRQGRLGAEPGAIARASGACAGEIAEVQRGSSA